MDTSHCGKPTNTSWRPSDTCAHARAFSSLRSARTPRCALAHVHPHVSVSPFSAPRDKHERIYIGSLLRKRNEMKRRPTIARRWSVQSIAPPPHPPPVRPLLFRPGSRYSSMRARARERIVPICRIDEQMTIGKITLTRVLMRARARTLLIAIAIGCTRGCAPFGN